MRHLDLYMSVIFSINDIDLQNCGVREPARHHKTRTKSKSGTYILLYGAISTVTNVYAQNVYV